MGSFYSGYSRRCYEVFESCKRSGLIRMNNMAIIAHTRGLASCSSQAECQRRYPRVACSSQRRYRFGHVLKATVLYQSRSKGAAWGIEGECGRERGWTSRMGFQQQQGRPVTACQSGEAVDEKAESSIQPESVSVVLLAGGVGKRMGASIPKQYLELKGKPIATYSMETFAQMDCVKEIVVVCEPEWRPIFDDCYASLKCNVGLKYALPGAERQDSVCNGLQEIDPKSKLVAIHDSARPLITIKDTENCIKDAQRVGAAVLGVPVKPTIKEADADGMVVKTLNRSVLWEVQTPQVIEPKMLVEGFELVKRENLEVTDDVSIIEAMGNPVIITKGCYTNIKVTTPEDMAVAEGFLDNN